MKTIKLHRDDYTRFMKDVDGAKLEIKKSYFDVNGPCRLAAPSGRFIAIVREDPGGESTVVSEEEAAPVEEISAARQLAQEKAIKRQRAGGLVTRAPSPKSCKCSTWPLTEGETIPTDGKGKPTAHRRTCAWRTMYERQTGMRMSTVPAMPQLKATIHSKVSNTSVQKPQLMGRPGSAKNVKDKIQKIPRPDNCIKCKEFTKTKKMLAEEAELGAGPQHHAICEHYKKYKALSLAQKAHGIVPKPEPVNLKKNPVKLLSLETQEVVRDAEDDEVIEARRALRDDGAAIITVDDEAYLVMHEDGTSLEPAEAEPEAPVAAEGEEAADTVPPPEGETPAEDHEEDQTGTD